MKKWDITFSNRKNTRSFSPRRTSWHAAVRNSQRRPSRSCPLRRLLGALPGSRRAVSAHRGAGTAQPRSAAERQAPSRRAAALSARAAQALPRSVPGPPRFRHSRPRAAKRFHAGEAGREPAPPVPPRPVGSEGSSAAPVPARSRRCHAHPPEMRGERSWARPYLAEHLQVVLLVIELQHLGGGGEQRRRGRTGDTREVLEPSPASGGQRRPRRPTLRFHPSRKCGRRPRQSRSPGRRNWPPAVPPPPARPGPAPGSPGARPVRRSGRGGGGGRAQQPGRGGIQRDRGGARATSGRGRGVPAEVVRSRGRVLLKEPVRAFVEVCG